MFASGFSERLKPGARIAIGIGSRGIANIATIVKGVVEFWLSKGFHPFLFPAMGSHGAATAEGQAGVLAHYGIHQATMGCPVLSSLDVVSVGKTPEGIETFLDRHASESDGIFLVNRIKWHTDFAGKIESGLFKMMAIGLGKFAGARNYHNYAYRLGIEHVIRTVGRQVLESGKILGGLAILEDAYHNTAQLTPVPVEQMEREEEHLLALAKSWMGRIPVPALDVLIVDQISKTISGAGMDTKVVNRGVNGEYNPWPELPRVERIFIRGLGEIAYGNAVGIGMSDMIHERLLAKVDWPATRVNCLTACTPANVRIPIHYPSDRQCLETLAAIVGKIDPLDVTYGWIRNTLELATLTLSENLLPQVQANPSVEILGPAFDMQFDDAGDLAELPLCVAK